MTRPRGARPLPTDPEWLRFAIVRRRRAQLRFRMDPPAKSGPLLLQQPPGLLLGAKVAARGGDLRSGGSGFLRAFLVASPAPLPVQPVGEERVVPCPAAAAVAFSFAPSVRGKRFSFLDGRSSQFGDWPGQDSSAVGEEAARAPTSWFWDRGADGARLSPWCNLAELRNSEKSLLPGGGRLWAQL